MHNYYKSRLKCQKQSTEFLFLMNNKIITSMKEENLKQRIGQVQLRWESEKLEQ